MHIDRKELTQELTQATTRNLGVSSESEVTLCGFVIRNRLSRLFGVHTKLIRLATIHVVTQSDDSADQR